MANTIVYGYPQPIGAKVMIMVDHAGPVSYVQYTTSAVGDVMNASDIGMGGIESAYIAFGGYTADGLYYVIPMFSKAADLVAGSATPRITFKWYTLVGGAFTAITTTEVTAAVDLHASLCRVKLICV